MPLPMTIEIQGDRIRLHRDQWKNNDAYITNYPGLLDEVKKYTWTYVDGEHPYLRCGTLNMFLHHFVLQYLYGKDKLDKMLEKSNIIEHLDNNGLNCTYENLHVLSSDLNKAKAFTIDKKNAALKDGELTDIPALITDVYYLHQHKLFQLQVFFNKNLVFNTQNGNVVESFTFFYSDFERLYIDWLYCFECIKEERFDVYKNNADKFHVEEATLIDLREDEKDAVFIKRDGQLYFVIRTDPDKGPLAYMEHTARRDFLGEKKCEKRIMQIKYENIILRDMVKSDIEDYVRWFTTETEWSNTDAPWEPIESDEETERTSWREYYESVKKLSDDVRRWKFEIEWNGRHIGWVSSYPIDENYEWIGEIKDGQTVYRAIGIDICEPDVWGKGIGTNALRAFMNYYFENGVDELYTQTWSGNVRMLRCAEKLGFVECNRNIGTREVDGKKYDGLTFRLEKR